MNVNNDCATGSAAPFRAAIIVRPLRARTALSAWNPVLSGLEKTMIAWSRYCPPYAGSSARFAGRLLLMSGWGDLLIDPPVTVARLYRMVPRAALLRTMCALMSSKTMDSVGYGMTHRLADNMFALAGANRDAVGVNEEQYVLRRNGMLSSFSGS